MRNPKAALALALVGLVAATGGSLAAYRVGYVPNTPAWWIRVGQQEVRNTLIDPDSAKFSEVVSPWAGWACGNVNARNGYGGYTGKTGFVWRSDEKVLLNPGKPDLQAYGETMISAIGLHGSAASWTRPAHDKAVQWCEYARAEAECLSAPPAHKSVVERDCAFFDRLYYPG